MKSGINLSFWNIYRSGIMTGLFVCFLFWLYSVKELVSYKQYWKKSQYNMLFYHEILTNQLPRNSVNNPNKSQFWNNGKWMFFYGNISILTPNFSLLASRQQYKWIIYILFLWSIHRFKRSKSVILVLLNLQWKVRLTYMSKIIILLNFLLMR